MQALGNDFIVIDAQSLLATPATQTLLRRWQEVLPALAQRLSSRRFGIGADGLILAIDLKQKQLSELASQIYGGNLAGCQLAWTFTNSDGSPAEICGNGLRCLGLWAYKKGLLKDRAKVLTETGPVEIAFRSEEEIEVDLGTPYLSAGEVPFTGIDSGKQAVASTFDIGDERFQITCLSMGNPHCLLFSGAPLANKQIELPFDGESQLQTLPAALTALAEKIQADARFPQGVNVSFILSHKRDSVQAIVFERGCGPTLACGSAAAAILVGGVLEGRLDRQATITLPGGSLRVNWSNQDNRVRITGTASLVFEGHLALPPGLFNFANRTALSGAMAQ